MDPITVTGRLGYREGLTPILTIVKKLKREQKRTCMTLMLETVSIVGKTSPLFSPHIT